MTDATCATSVDEQLTLNGKGLEDLHAAVDSFHRSQAITTKRLDDLMLLVANISKDLRKLHSQSPTSTHAILQFPENTTVHQDAHHHFPKLDFPLFDGHGRKDEAMELQVDSVKISSSNGEGTDEFTDSTIDLHRDEEQQLDASRSTTLKVTMKGQLISLKFESWDDAHQPFVEMPVKADNTLIELVGQFFPSKLEAAEVAYQVLDTMTKSDSVEFVLDWAGRSHSSNVQGLEIARHMLDGMPKLISVRPKLFSRNEDMDSNTDSILSFDYIWLIFTPESCSLIDDRSIFSFDPGILPIDFYSIDDFLTTSFDLGVSSWHIRECDIINSNGMKQDFKIISGSILAFDVRNWKIVICLVLGEEWIIVNFEGVGIDRVVGWLMCGWFWRIKQLCIPISCLIIHENIATEFMLEIFVNWCLDVKVLDFFEGCEIGIVDSKGQYEMILIFVSTTVNEVPQNVEQNIVLLFSSIENGIQFELILIVCAEDIQQEDEAVANNSVLELNQLSPWSWAIEESFINVVINDATNQQRLIDYAWSHAIISNEPCCDIITEK